MRVTKQTLIWASVLAIALIGLLLWSPRARDPSEGVLVGRLLGEVNKALAIYVRENGSGPESADVAALFPYADKVIKEFSGHIVLSGSLVRYPDMRGDAVVAKTVGFENNAYVEKSGRITYEKKPTDAGVD